MLRWGIRPSTAGGEGTGHTVGSLGASKHPVQVLEGAQSKQIAVNTSLWVRQHKRAKEQIR